MPRQMDLYELRLRRLEADYAETIAAGERAEERGKYQELHPDTPDMTEHAVDDEHFLVEEAEKSAKIDPVPHHPRAVTDPMDQAQVDAIKASMQTVKFSHEPSWAKTLSDDQLKRMLGKLLDSE